MKRNVLFVALFVGLIFSACVTKSKFIEYEREADLAMENGNYLDAIKLYSKGIKLIGKGKSWSSMELYGKRGMAYLTIGKLKESKKNFAIILETGKLNRYSDQRYKDLVFELSIPYPVYATYQRGLKAENNDTAIQEYSQVITLAPDYAYAYFERGLLYYKLGMYDECKNDLLEAIRLNPEMGKAHLELGYFYIAHGDYAKALVVANEAMLLDAYWYGAKAESLKKIVETGINNRVPELLELANAARDRKDYTTAITQYRNILKLNDRHIEAKTNLPVVWNVAIAAAEAKNMYPAPFEGRWEYFQAALPGIPTYHPGTSSQDVVTHQQNGTITITRIGSTSGYYTNSGGRPERRVVYEFNRNNYTKTDSGSSQSGTFFYNGNTIELDDGTILKLENNHIIEQISEYNGKKAERSFTKK